MFNPQGSQANNGWKTIDMGKEICRASREGKGGTANWYRDGVHRVDGGPAKRFDAGNARHNTEEPSPPRLPRMKVILRICLDSMESTGVAFVVLGYWIQCGAGRANKPYTANESRVVQGSDK